jgi:hypothetical protein
MTSGMRTNVIVVRRQEAANMKTMTNRAWVIDLIITLMLREIWKRDERQRENSSRKKDGTFLKLMGGKKMMP